MSKNENFVIKARIKHGDKYSYTKLDYVNNSQKVIIICNLHGDFEQRPDAHLSGQGCPTCGRRSNPDKTRENFIKASILKFGDKIDHSRTVYESYNKKVTLFCRTHGSFTLKPSTHIHSKHGCTKCGLFAASELKKENSGKLFIPKSNEIHKNIYNYSKVLYKGDKEKVLIICENHGEFWQTPMKHLAGQGCKECAKHGYRQQIEGNFYIFSNDEVTKVGITNRNPSERLKKINRTSDQNFKLICFFNFKDGSIPFNIEKNTLSYLRSKYKPVNETFDGSTECFLDVNLAELINYVTPLAS